MLPEDCIIVPLSEVHPDIVYRARKDAERQGVMLRDIVIALLIERYDLSKAATIKPQAITDPARESDGVGYEACGVVEFDKAGNLSGGTSGFLGEFGSPS